MNFNILINAMFPDVASDSIVSDVPAPTSNFLGVLKTLKVVMIDLN